MTFVISGLTNVIFFIFLMKASLSENPSLEEQ